MLNVRHSGKTFGLPGEGQIVPSSVPVLDRIGSSCVGELDHVPDGRPSKVEHLFGEI